MIDREDIDRLKEIFVTRQECNTQMDGVNNKLSEDAAEFAVIKTKLNAILWGLSVTGAAVIGVLVKIVFER